MQKKKTNTTAETIKETDNTSFTVLYNIFKKKSVDHSADRSEVFDCQFCKTILGSKLLGFSF